jgi:hypothetical protein
LIFTHYSLFQTEYLLTHVMLRLLTSIRFSFAVLTIAIFELSVVPLNNVVVVVVVVFVVFVVNVDNDDSCCGDGDSGGEGNGGGNGQRRWISWSIC